ncbi:tetratricopeptide repeat protein [Actinokineospora soli]|uniref:Tetratricopeptide repeat protein n=1 Tax=Actinokineospora soli TaxID=1048753 RepID=A0ABW2TUK4_9PSEU
MSEETLLHGDRLLAAWERAGVPESDPLRLRLMGQLANLARALGERDRAKKLDTEALDVQTAVHPVLPPAALALCAGLGGDDRGLGNYHDALATDQQTWVGLVRELGEDHPRTRMAANNLAASLYLLGDVQGALEAERHNHDRLTRLFGPGHERTDWSEVRLAVYERDLGLGDPVERLRELFQRLSGKPGRERLSRIACWQWSMALRDRGSLGPALTRANEALQGLRTMLPPTHPDIIAAMLTNASIVRRADGRAREALATAERACAELDPRDIGPEHPFRALAGLGLGLAIAAAGDHDAGTAAVAAAGAALHARFDRVHPWTLAAELDLAVLTAASGDRDTAVELTEAALDDLLDADAVGPAHPYVQVAEHNLRLAAAGELGNWREIDVDIPHT